MCMESQPVVFAHICEFCVFAHCICRTLFAVCPQEITVHLLFMSVIVFDVSVLHVC